MARLNLYPGFDLNGTPSPTNMTTFSGAVDDESKSLATCSPRHAGLNFHPPHGYLRELEYVPGVLTQTARPGCERARLGCAFSEAGALHMVDLGSEGAG